MKNSEYLSLFLQGIDLAGTIDEEFLKDSRKVDAVKSYILDATSGRHDDVYQKLRPVLSAMANQSISGLNPYEQTGRRCHIISDLFNRRWRQDPNNPIWLFLTIGDVKHKGESVYDVTDFDVIHAIKQGPKPDIPLKVHAWLTLEDMTIVDLTIMASLLRLNWVSEGEYAKMPVVSGKPEELVDFEYTPYLVDNNFVARVDGPRR